MKKLTALLLTLILMISIAIPALSESTNGTYDSAKQFIAALEKEDIGYDYLGVDSHEYDVVNVELEGDNTTVSLYFYFNSDGEDVAIRVWDLITYDEAMDDAVVRAANTLNQNYRFAYFYGDTDFTVTGSMDVIFHDGDDIGAICYDAMMFVADVCDTVYPDLLPYSNQ
jgi:hypothetical protein